MKDITPEDSVIPVYQTTFTADEIETMKLADREMERQEQEAKDKIIAKEAAMSRFERLGFTQEEIDALLN